MAKNKKNNLKKGKLTMGNREYKLENWNKLLEVPKSEKDIIKILNMVNTAIPKNTKKNNGSAYVNTNKVIDIFELGDTLDIICKVNLNDLRKSLDEHLYNKKVRELVLPVNILFTYKNKSKSIVGETTAVMDTNFMKKVILVNGELDVIEAKSDSGVVYNYLFLFQLLSVMYPNLLKMEQIQSGSMQLNGNSEFVIDELKKVLTN